MVPGKLDLTLYRGDSFDLPLRLREKLPNGTAGDPLNLTGCTVTAQVRTTEDETNPLVSFACTITNPTGGELTCSLTKTQTQALTGNGLWDVQVTWPDGKVRTYLKGKVTLLKDVTRP